ncbi:MAG: hypothetical protein JNJ48_03205 [Phycisphaerae bacterium]|nr:hypothetical protein [Phycisphaerae bacterium]
MNNARPSRFFTRVLSAVAVAIGAAVASAGGCAASADAGGGPGLSAGEARMTLVYLVTGPTSAANTPEQKKEIFAGHMANMKRLAERRQLLVAGPFGRPHDPSWRGIFVFDVPTAAQARALAETDPGVIAGEFAVRVVEVAAPVSLRRAQELEDRMQADLKANPPAPPAQGQLPPGLRRYVMAHARDCDATRAAFSVNTGAPRTIFCLRFTGGDAPSGQGAAAPGSGLFVLDAQSVDAARAALRGVAPGSVTLDQWMSTKSLEGLAVGGK